MLQNDERDWIAGEDDMTTFTYEAMNSMGQVVKGEIDASSNEEAAAKVRAKGEFATNIQEIPNSLGDDGDPITTSALRAANAIWYSINSDPPEAVPLGEDAQKAAIAEMVEYAYAEQDEAARRLIAAWDEMCVLGRVTIEDGKPKECWETAEQARQDLEDAMKGTT